jgi:PIN domain nuclease of toxin-antitoxin system
VAQLVKRATLSLPLPLPEWFDAALSESGVDCLPVNPVLLHASIILPDLHRDPADRIIIATAQMHDAILVTADGTIQAYPGLRWIRKPSGE